ncbi:unnamed protein product, partial [marine sediment metagenome]
MRVASHILGKLGPKGDFHKKLQLLKVHPNDSSPSVLVENVVITNHIKTRKIGILNAIKA